MNNVTKTPCCLCSQIDGNPENDLISQLLPQGAYCRRIAMESENFAVVPSLGPLTPGHSLICPKGHVKSFAGLDPQLSSEFKNFKALVSARMKSIFAAPIHYFEHGSSSAGDRVICTVDHAHLHLVPMSVEIVTVLLSDKRWKQVTSDLLELRVRTAADEYLYYEDPNGAAFLACAGRFRFDSQHMRKIFAEALGKPDDWNWRDRPRPDEAERTFKALAAA
jgi:ATP adenylyltransferase